MQDKINALATGAIGVTSTAATSAVTDAMLNVDIAQLTQTIVNILIGIITVYKLLQPKKDK